MTMTRATIHVFLLAAVGAALITTRSAVAETVIDMPPPPRPAKALPTQTEDAAKQSQVVTWRDRRNVADVAGPQRSYLGTVALSRYRNYRSRSYNRYFVLPNRFPGHRIHFGFGRHGFHHGHHFPFNVSFLHGVPAHHGGYDWPWSGFGRPFTFFGTW